MGSGDYDYWLFDLDGTLVDVECSYPIRTVGAVGDRLGVVFDEPECQRLWYGMAGTRERVLDRHGVAPEAFWRAFDAVEDADQRAQASYVYPDAGSFVPEIDAPVGLVTHCDASLTEPILDALDVADWFDAVVCCSAETGFKPDPAPVERARSNLDLGPTAGDAGVMAGDDAHDVGAAWNAGIDGVHVERRDPAETGHCVRGDRRVRRLDELQ